MLSLLLSTAMAGPGWTLVMPFGVGLYTHGKPVRGTIYAGTQAGGIALAVSGSLVGDQALVAGDNDSALTWRYITLGGASFAVASYFVALLDGSRVHQLELSDRRPWPAYPQEEAPEAYAFLLHTEPYPYSFR